MKLLNFENWSSGEIFSQKPFKFFIPSLKTPQPVLPYYAAVFSRDF